MHNKIDCRTNSFMSKGFTSLTLNYSSSKKNPQTVEMEESNCEHHGHSEPNKIETETLAEQ